MGPAWDGGAPFLAWVAQVQGACGIERRRPPRLASSWETQTLVLALLLTYCVTLISN